MTDQQEGGYTLQQLSPGGIPDKSPKPRAPVCSTTLKGLTSEVNNAMFCWETSGPDIHEGAS